jgi:selenocysteine lyase/cysteine desulfurase
MPYDLDAVRAQYPALGITDNGKRRIYFDNPAGTRMKSCSART